MLPLERGEGMNIYMWKEGTASGRTKGPTYSFCRQVGEVNPLLSDGSIIDMYMPNQWTNLEQQQ